MMLIDVIVCSKVPSWQYKNPGLLFVKFKGEKTTASEEFQRMSVKAPLGTKQ